jgi:hypothetical protein
VNGDASFNKRLFIGGGLNMMPAATSSSYIASFLNDNPLFIRSDLNHGLAYGNSNNTIFNTGVDGPLLFGYSGGALGTYQNATTNIALTWGNDKSITLNGPTNIKGSNFINFGSDQTKEGSAGKMGYGTFSGGGSLDIVGAGTTSSTRAIRMWDNVAVQGSLSAGGFTTGGSSSFGSISGTNIGCNNVSINNSGQGLSINNSSGADAVQITKVNGSANFCMRLDNNGGTSQGNYLIFFNNGSAVGRITSTNTTTVALTNGSDYRLKQNIRDLTDAEHIIEHLKPVSFEFKIDPDVRVGGFIAHELQEFIPRCVDGTKDGVDASGNPIYQGVDIVPMIPYMVKMSQIQNKRISDLQAENSNLKQQIAEILERLTKANI